MQFPHSEVLQIHGVGSQMRSLCQYRLLCLRRNTVILSAQNIRGEKIGKSMEDIVKESPRNDSRVEKEFTSLSGDYVYSGFVGSNQERIPVPNSAD